MSRPFQPHRLDRLSATSRVPDIYNHLIARNNVNWQLSQRHRKLTSKEVSNIEWAFLELSRGNLEYGAIRAIAEMIGVPDKTVRGWCQQLLVNPEWRPNKDGHARHSTTGRATERANRTRFHPEEALLSSQGRQ